MVLVFLFYSRVFLIFNQWKEYILSIYLLPWVMGVYFVAVEPTLDVGVEYINFI